MPFPFAHPIPVAYSQLVLWRFSSYECAELVGMREPLCDRCLTLEIQRDPWLNGYRTNQCNHAGVWGKWGQRDTVCLPATPELLARLEHQVCFCMHGMADSWLTSRVLHRLEVPTDASQRAQAAVPRELDHGECDECLGSLAEEGTRRPALRVWCQAPQKPLVIFC